MRQYRLISVKHQLAGSVKNRLISVYFFMRDYQKTQRKTEYLKHSADVDNISTKEEQKTRKPVTDGIEARENLEEKVGKKIKLNGNIL